MQTRATERHNGVTTNEDKVLQEWSPRRCGIAGKINGKMHGNQKSHWKDVWCRLKGFQKDAQCCITITVSRRGAIRTITEIRHITTERAW
ncbi:hypothetical protein HAX54_002121 [Datura stramonium]|uniref:Uncharacterized protein n=1 Tax=Datura stramonium TaxID=4076 RepID=A0ABS8T3F1_DATST|nr:hypothetical protein [Datura stramonium]